ncbi:MAG: zinc-binding dehydrogenase [Verrucomicrobiales bacterium]|nr:zinc-binding dehydrogenase [Verrucomicrobiales bacterium]
MSTSRVAVFREPGRPFDLETVALPPLKTGEILVRNEYTTLCRSDLHTFLGKRTEKSPTILGHEIVGRIAAIGPGAPRHDLRGAELSIGHRITWAIYASNPDSPLSRLGIPQKGEGLFKYGHERVTPDCHLHGGLSEYCLLRRHTPIVRVDVPVPLPVLSLVNCAVATVAGALRLAGGLSNRRVLVAGAGMLGLAACAMARVAGAQQVIAVDIDPDRLRTALRFGADATWLAEPGAPALRSFLEQDNPNEPLTVALDFSGAPETIEIVLGALGIGGTLVLVGSTFPQRALQIDAERLVRHLLTVRGLHNYNERDLITAVDFIERHHRQFPFETLVCDPFALDQVNEAFAYAVTSGVHRVGIRCESPTTP